ncbi:unnamed protein product [Peniophora sp. CBMAI 1063]|nr:unnamed protein product [Peniophora sp. CBMAI 1063]
MRARIRVLPETTTSLNTATTLHIEMEIDMRSSSFLSPRPMKRSRSPDGDDEALGAPSAKKRLSLATANSNDMFSMPMGVNMFAFQQPQSSSPGMAPPGPSMDEHWVVQTRRISISRQTPPEDDMMNTDPEPMQPQPAQTQTPGMQQQQQFPQAQYPTAPDIQVMGAPSYPTPAPSPGPITLPPLPLNPFLRAEHTSAHTPPIQSLMLPQQIPQQQRPRFSMGPRPNCDLCRRRVEGHYAHVD